MLNSYNTYVIKSVSIFLKKIFDWTIETMIKLSTYIGFTESVNLSIFPVCVEN